ncbi:hypothetical protein A4G99_23555 [Haladaptatus sp. R4]|uniref:hypothetical protein n=1 Tax=Haladaptatus sp. R4 TaxID=1679489 RepID=UPI0007B4EE49|nr:hypothetical protein [Haladaptatus sp. R4]KZN26055.1 hypothetical protein A4G99_23555 [Haladaptatus sp. R4]
MSADKRIPVTEERFRELGDLKGAGETYDELLAELIEEHKKRRLLRDMKQIEDESEFVPLDEA